MRVRSIPNRKRTKNTKALESWDNEGGTTPTPQEDRDKPVALTEKEEHILRCLGAAVILKWTDLLTDTNVNSLESRYPWVSRVTGSI